MAPDGTIHVWEYHKEDKKAANYLDFLVMIDIS